MFLKKNTKLKKNFSIFTHPRKTRLELIKFSFCFSATMAELSLNSNRSSRQHNHKYDQ